MSDNGEQVTAAVMLTADAALTATKLPSDYCVVDAPVDVGCLWQCVPRPKCAAEADNCSTPKGRAAAKKRYSTEEQAYEKARAGHKQKQAANAEKLKALQRLVDPGSFVLITSPVVSAEEHVFVYALEQVHDYDHQDYRSPRHVGTVDLSAQRAVTKLLPVDAYADVLYVAVTAARRG